MPYFGQVFVRHRAVVLSDISVCAGRMRMSTVYAVLRGKCLSVDEPILGSTPALRIPASLVTPTPKYSLISGVAFTSSINSEQARL